MNEALKALDAVQMVENNLDHIAKHPDIATAVNRIKLYLPIIRAALHAQGGDGVWTPEMKSAAMKDAAEVCKLSDKQKELFAVIADFARLDYIPTLGEQSDLCNELCRKHAAIIAEAQEAGRKLT